MEARAQRRARGGARGWPPRVVSGCLALVVAVGAVLLGAGISPAAAHTELVSSEPSAGEVLSAAPSAVTLTFSEALQSPAYVVVTGPDGETLAEGEGEVDGATVRQSLAGAGESDQRGTYVVSYRVVSADGHAVQGELDFAVGRPVRVPRTIRRRGGAVVGWAIVGGIAVLALVVAARRRPR